ncbi:MAG: LysM peptidoglycan-binding domain-containing protein [Kiritimatiellae bacterium]|nr:LysM peptidoglycan-binding domain-containing protein [Kiritimatiellia bacterium]
MRTPALVAVVVLLHLVAVSAFIFIQGCGTQRPAGAPPSAPVMPPREAPAPAPQTQIQPPVFQPPVPVETAPEVVKLEAGQAYTVQKGDSLSAIAKRHGVSAKDLADVNGIKDPNKIRIGQKLVLPLHAAAQAGAKPGARPSAPVSAPVSGEKVAAGGGYVVVRGDTLSGIAARHGVSVKALREANKLASDRILIGQKLAIPGRSAPAPAAPVKQASKPAPAAPASAPAPVVEPAAAMPAPPPAPEEPQVAPERAFEYTVAPGDTLDSIARDFVVLKEDIVKVNNLSGAESLKPGQKLVIPMP